MAITFRDKIASANSIINGLSSDSDIINSGNSDGVQAEIELKFAEQVEKKLEGALREVFRMRSTYLPIELISNTQSKTMSEKIGITFHQSESYENAFMRMLGMPGYDEVLKAAQNESLLIMNPDGSKQLTNVSGTAASVSSTIDVLNEREVIRVFRKIKIGSYIYDGSAKPVVQLSDAEIDVNQAAFEYSSPTLESIYTDFFKFSYLLLPPIQDSRVSKCINEPEKITAPLFASRNAIKLNNKLLKQTLLEAIIRIRVDRLTGGSSLLETDGLIPIDADSYGLLEAMFIVKLKSMIDGMAVRLQKSVDIVNTDLLKLNNDLSVSNNSTSANNTPPKGTSVNIKTQTTIEDALLSLLNDDDNSIDLQIQTQRNSGVKNAHLMSSLLSIVALKRERLKSESDKIDKGKKSKSKSGDKKLPSRKQSPIENILGINTGVGMIDVAAFALGMFLVSENDLIGLLDESSFERMRALPAFEGYDFTGRNDMVSSINSLSEMIKSIYDSFSEILSG